MYKSKLQLFCQQKSWMLPDYTTTKNGPDHNLRFTATVTVNGVPFENPDQCRTVKEAQNSAAKVALDHLSGPAQNQYPSLPSPVTILPSASIPTSSPATMTGTDSGPSIGGMSQPTMARMVSTPLGDEAPLMEKDDNKFADVRHLYKHGLQTYAQKRNLLLPEYSYECEGPPHASRFRSKVTIDGKTYECPDFFRTVKEAQHAAAEIAWKSLSPSEVLLEDDSILYKNLLQELAQKEGFHAPTYTTDNFGLPHLKTFISTVEIGGQSYKGEIAKNKKQAEMNAAKVAYIGFKEQWQNKDEERTGCSEPLQITKSGGASLNPTVLPAGCQLKDALKVSSSIMQSVIGGDLQQRVTPEAKLEIRQEKDVEQIDGDEEKFATMTKVNTEISTRRDAAPPEGEMNAKRYRCSPDSDHAQHTCLQDPFPSASSSCNEEDGVCSPTTTLKGATNSFVDSNIKPNVGAGGTSTVPRENILVYPRVPNMTNPAGAKVLREDGKWVAFKMNSSSQ